MNRPTTALLAAITVLLAANLVIQTSKPVEAAGAGPGEPYVVQITGGTAAVSSQLWGSNLFRLWSDGAIDVWKVSTNAVNGTTNETWFGWVDLEPVARADLDANGCVGIQDFLILLADWNDPCEP
jgi:hypothetical protein